LKIKKIIIVGGGTAGLTTALILKTRFESVDIQIIKSNQIGIIGVGEGTTEHWSAFMDMCGITQEELVCETDATLKFGVMFKNWTPKPYFHFVDNDQTIQAKSSAQQFTLAQYELYYAYHISKGTSSQDMLSPIIWNNKVAIDSHINQYHFNTLKLNNFLVKKCKEKKITFIEDIIEDVEVTDKIENLKGQKRIYSADFYIDCSGFRKLLISKLNAKWKSFNLLLNEAIAFQTPDTTNYNCWTLSQAMDAGWMWRIPTYGRWGNGYVYNNNYINKDQAKTEVEKVLGHSIEIAKNIKFQDGALDKCWIKNCVAIGLSAVFAEPLEASSISVSLHQALLLGYYLNDYNEKVITKYNKQWSLICSNVRNFIAIHYLVDKNTPFWKNEKITFSPEFKEQLDYWKHHLPLVQDFQATFLLFRNCNFILILHGIDYFNRKAITQEVESYPFYLQTLMQRKYKAYRERKLYNLFEHKDYLTRLREEGKHEKGNYYFFKNAMEKWDMVEYT